MRRLKTFILILLVLLNVAAGIPKILQMPQELGFLQAIGLNGTMVSILGLIQVTAGILLVFPKVRLLGSILAAVALAISTAAIFATGNTLFGFVSVLPILLLGVIVIDTMKPKAQSVEQ